MTNKRADYHLRPHKAVDRNLFIESLIRLRNNYDFCNYQYIGFGSYEFEDFKLIYRSLGIDDLHSIEMNTNVFKRQGFNKPYSFIQLHNTTCGSFFDEIFDNSKHSIIWADFSLANDKYSQCLDISNICGKVQAGDIIRFTLNAQPSSMDNIPSETPIPKEEKCLHRYEFIKDELKEYFPIDSSPNDMEATSYPKFLLKAIKRAMYKDLDPDLVPCPICSYAYADNMQMITFTAIMCSTSELNETIEELKKLYNNWEQYITINSWDEVIFIKLPPLTIHEQLEICQLAKKDGNYKDIEEKIGLSQTDIERYLKFSRYYPNYQPVSI